MFYPCVLYLYKNKYPYTCIMQSPCAYTYLIYLHILLDRWSWGPGYSWRFWSSQEFVRFWIQRHWYECQPRCWKNFASFSPSRETYCLMLYCSNHCRKSLWLFWSICRDDLEVCCWWRNWFPNRNNRFKGIFDL